jgi:hypothetical protein
MTRLIKKHIIPGIVIATCTLGMTLATAGCASQTTLADLIAIVGTSIASVETIDGNTAAVAKIQTDTAAATTEVLAWKSGTPTTEVIEALNLVEDDLNALPVSTLDTQYIDLAIGTVNEILTLIPASTTTATVVHDAVPHRQVHLAKTPKDAKTYKKIWNGLAEKDSKFNSTVLK